MKRRLFLVAAALSLIVAIALAALWVRSYFDVDLLGYDHPADAQHHQRTRWVILDVGTIRLCTQRTRLRPGDAEHLGFFRTSRPVARDEDPLRECKTDGEYFAGFGRYQKSQKEDPANFAQHAVTWNVLAIPFWPITLAAFSLLPLRWMLRYARKLRRGKGVCANCGYDLRATPERCPECGTTATIASPAR